MSKLCTPRGDRPGRRLPVFAEQLQATLGIDVVEAVKAKLGPAAVPAVAARAMPPAPKPPAAG